MTITDMEQAVNNARAEIRRAEQCKNSMATILVDMGLKGVNTYNLVRLKRMLHGYDAHRKCWKEAP